MKKMVLGMAALAITSCGSNAPENVSTSAPKAVAPAPLSSADAKRIADKIAADEAKILRMSVTGSEWTATVRDDGTRRDGFAMYLCEVLRVNNGATGATIKVVDGRARLLGSSAC